jgi:hypothetical protein
MLRPATTELDDPVKVYNFEVDGAPSELTGYTKHGINSAISHDGVGVQPSAILDTLKKSIDVIPQTNGTLRFIGESAKVTLNPGGEVVTAWARSSRIWR